MGEGSQKLRERKRNGRQGGRGKHNGGGREGERDRAAVRRLEKVNTQTEERCGRV